jgi:adenylate cyclase
VRRRTPSGKRVGLAVGLLVTLAIAALQVASVSGRSGLLAQFELKATDWRFRLRGPVAADPRIVVLAIDQKSIDALGRWPWPRRVLAEVIAKVAEGGPKVLALDVAFPLPEVNALTAMRDLPPPAGWSRERLDEWIAAQGGDRLLADALRRIDRIVLGYFFLTSRDEAGHLSGDGARERDARLAGDAFRNLSFSGDRGRTGVPTVIGAEPNVTTLRDAAFAAGFFNVPADPDGMVRKLPLVLGYGDDYFPGLALAAGAAFLDLDARRDAFLVFREYGLDELGLRDRGGRFSRVIPNDGAGRVMLNFRGPGAFPHVSIADVLNGAVPPSRFADSLVFLGATAVGIGDTVATPLAENGPGVEVQATFADNLLRGDFIRRPDWTPAVELALVVVLGLAITWITLRLGPVAAPLVAVAGIVAVVVGEQALFTRERVVLGMVFPVLAIGLVFVPVYALRTVGEVRTKNRIKRAFARYLHPAVVERIAASPDEVVTGGERREITVLVADIRGFTTWCAGADSEVVVATLNEVLDRMTTIILKHEGFLDKYIGDALLAFWGAPARQDDHARRALACAREMESAVDELNAAFSTQGRPALAVRIGVASGPAIVGNVGSRHRLDYTAIGDCVNLAARLEQAGKRYPGGVLVDGTVADRAGAGFTFQEVAREVLIEGLGATRIVALVGETDGGSFSA